MTMRQRTRKPRIRSSLPAGFEERLLNDYEESGGGFSYRTTECRHNSQVVGQRRYSRDGVLVMETPLRDGRKHGREYTWDENGWLSLVEPYAYGKIHGTARQYDEHGRVIGTYRCVHGTGYDIWRSWCSGETPSVSEIRALRDGERHGYEWWVNEDQRSVHHETHLWAGQHHGIERMWNAAGKLNRGYPRYWVNGARVTRRQYLRAAKRDATLPPWREQDNNPRRVFPAEAGIQR